MYKATQLSACDASALWRAGERSRSGGVRLVARRALTLLNAPLYILWLDRGTLYVAQIKIITISIIMYQVTKCKIHRSM